MPKNIWNCFSFSWRVEYYEYVLINLVVFRAPADLLVFLLLWPPDSGVSLPRRPVLLLLQVINFYLILFLFERVRSPGRDWTRACVIFYFMSKNNLFRSFEKRCEYRDIYQLEIYSLNLFVYHTWTNFSERPLGVFYIIFLLIGCMKILLWGYLTFLGIFDLHG